MNPLDDLLRQQPALTGMLAGQILSLNDGQLVRLTLRQPKILANKEVRAGIIDRLNTEAWFSILYYSPSVAKYGRCLNKKLDEEQKELLITRHGELTKYL